MDLVRDRYFGLSAASAEMWLALAAGSATTSSELRRGDVLAQQLTTWEKWGLIGGPPLGNPLVPHAKAPGVPATAELPGRDAGGAIHPFRIAQLIRTGLTARRWLRDVGVAAALTRVQAVPLRKKRPRQAQAILLSLVRNYYFHRRFAAQGKNDCLPRSLALALALRQLGFDPDICFGVRKFPFEAHAWVELESRVVNDTVDKIGRYSVIGRF